MSVNSASVPGLRADLLTNHEAKRFPFGNLLGAILFLSTKSLKNNNIMFGLQHKTKQANRIYFKDWIRREYLGIHIHPWFALAFDINTKWHDFPINEDVSEDTVLELEKWLYNHGACASCQANFKGAWKNYINDVW